MTMNDLLDPEHWIEWLKDPYKHLGMADRVLIAKLFEQTLQHEKMLEEWADEATPVIAALAIYGEGASIPALVAKARAMNRANHPTVYKRTESEQHGEHEQREKDGEDQGTGSP